MTVDEKREHHNKLRQILPNKSKELEYAYNWMSNRVFLDAVCTDVPNQYDFASKNMVHPPIKLLQTLKKRSKQPEMKLKEPTLTMAPPMHPKCNLCEKELADNIRERINYSVVKCQCGQQWCHIKCCEGFLMKKPHCTLCKKYFTLTTMKNSSLQQTLLRF